MSQLSSDVGDNKFIWRFKTLYTLNRMDNKEVLITLDDSFEKSPSKQTTIEPMPSTVHYSTTTQVKLKPLFDALNINFFNGLFELNGDIKWTDYLKSRTAAVLLASTPTGDTKRFLRVSKTLLKKCTRKQLIESLMYEMIFAYVKKFCDDRRPNHLRSVLKRAMDYVNATSAMELTFNYSFSAHNTIESYSQWIDGDDVSILQNNNTIICISDDESDEDDESNQLVDIRRNGCTEIQLVSNKIQLSDHSNGAFEQYLSVKAFNLCFLGANFHSNPNAKDSAKCPLCWKIVDRKSSLNFHFNDCVVFCT